MYSNIKRWLQYLPALRFAAIFMLTCSTISNAQIIKLNEAAEPIAKKWAPIFDFDNDSCLPAAAVSKTGIVNEGDEADGDDTTNCRDELNNSNTYVRSLCIWHRGNHFCAHVYSLYFEKDITFFDYGHKHDFEHAIAWTKNDALTHGSFSHHSDLITKPKRSLYFDNGKENHIKVVYHKDGLNTRAFRPAHEDERPENPNGVWLTPTLVDWYKMKGDGHVTNSFLRNLLNTYDFGAASLKTKDSSFPSALAKKPPTDIGYPRASTWEQAAVLGANLTIALTVELAIH